MADTEKEVAAAAAPRGADWEVVTLTASAYEAAPGPEGSAPGARGGGAGRSSSDPSLLLSDHFVFPPSEHENLPIQTSFFEEVQPEVDEEEEESVREASTSVEGYGFETRTGDPASERIEFYDEGRNLSVHDDDGETRSADDMPVYRAAEDAGHGFAAHDEGESDDEGLGQPAKSAGGCRSGDAGASSCKCWLKKHMTCLYHQAKETNAIWSVVVAAALVGIVILGRWHKDKLHINPLKWCSGSAVRG